MKLKQLGLVFGVLLLVTACGNKEVQETVAKVGTAVETMKVSTDTIAMESRVSGNVVSDSEVSIYPGMAGEVLSVNVKVGDKVGKNQVLFTIDGGSLTREYDALVEKYDLTKSLYDDQIALAEKSLNDTKTIQAEKVNTAKRNADNTKALFDVGAATQIELDDANFALTQAKLGQDTAVNQSEISLTQTKNTAKTTLTQLSNSMKDMEDTMGDTRAKSTIAGTVTAVNVKKGATATPQVAGVTISGSSKKQVLVSISENLKPYLKVNDRANVTIDSTKDKFEAVIDTISPSANATTKLYDVYLNIPSNIDVSFGMFAEATFKTDEREGVIVIPTEAILTDSDGEYVYVTTDNKTAKKARVETGLIGMGITEITNGLKEGHILIKKGQNYVKDGEEIRIV